jgi:hypothetical protein
VRREHILLLFAILLGQGCGLENIPVLNPPYIPAGGQGSETNYVFSFQSTTANNETDFRGFELFYKFYSDLTSVPPNPPATGAADVSWLLGLGYKPVCSKNSDVVGGTAVTHNAPLVPVAIADRGTSFTVSIDFHTLGTVTQPSFSYGGATQPVPAVEVRRAVGDNSVGSPDNGYPKTFIVSTSSLVHTYLATDADIGTSLLAAATTQGFAYFVVYVASYGFSTDQGGYYSLPLYLGYVKVDLNQ